MKNPLHHELARSSYPLPAEERIRLADPCSAQGRLLSSATVASLAFASSAMAQVASPTAVPQFAPPTDIPWSLCAPPVDIDFGDIDGDGDVDLVAGACNGLYWLENLNGEGSFGSAVLVDAFAGTPRVAVSDLDLDGDLDLVSFGHWDGIRWHENLDGRGSFGPGVPIGIGSTVGVTDVVAADLDGDGDQDLLGAWQLEDECVWFENDGQGGFGVGQRVAPLTLYAMPRSVDTADLDDDGDLDVLLALRGEDLAVWFENLDGLGSFGSQSTIAGVADASSISSGDLDGDGDPDVLTAAGQDNAVQWHENLDGLGSFATAPVGNGDDMVAADLDCDGDLDVLANNDADGWYPLQWSLVWHENVDGMGTYQPHYLEHGSSDVPFDVEAHPADLDGDGDLDILASGAPFGPLVWYRNLGCM